MADFNMQDVDLYELLGISSTSSVSEVKKAYRKKALTCHPDKNPDNPRASELFHQLSKALEILIDESARAAYDKVLNGKKAAKLRHRELDEKRKKLKEDLEAREKAAATTAAGKKVDTRSDEEKLQAEIERLRKEGSKQVEEEVEFVRKQILQESQVSPPEQPLSSGFNRLRIRWKASKDDPINGGYPYETLLKIMSKYGDIVALVVSPKKNGSALIEFKTKDAADTAYALEKGFLTNPLTIEKLVSETSKGSSQESDPGQYSKLSDLTKVDGGIPTANLFPTMNPSGVPLVGTTLPNFASAPPDFSQLLYANYLTGQQLRYPNCMAMPAHTTFPAPTQPTAQMMLPGAMVLPGMAGVGMSSVMGYGHVPQFPTYAAASHPSSFALPGYPSSLQYVTAGSPLVAAGSRASYAAGLPMFRGHMPSAAAAAAAAYPSLASAHVFYPQLLSGLPSVIPR